MNDMEKITAEDWIILRLIAVCMESGKYPSKNMDVLNSAVYMYKKYGARVTGDAYALIENQNE